MNYAGRSLMSFVSFNLGWWACALGPRYQMEWIGPVVLPFFLWLHLYFAPPATRAGELYFLFALGFAGFIIDTILIYFGIFEIIPSSLFTPPWLVCMWILLGLTFESMLVMRKNLGLVCLMGVLSGPLSYLFAQAVNILKYPDPAWRHLLLHALIWAGLMPVLFKMRDLALRKTV